MSMNLYEISEDIRHIQDLLESEDDENQQDRLLAAFDKGSENLEKKVTSIIHLLRNWEASAKACKDQKDAFAAREKMFNNKIKNLKQFLLISLQKIDAPKLVLEIATVSRRKGSEVVVIDDNLNLPQGYFKMVTDVKIDNVALKALWKNTDENERGDLSGFHVERKDETLQIK